nr:MAG: hypothetical protein 1 [Enamovirus sp.]
MSFVTLPQLPLDYEFPVATLAFLVKSTTNLETVAHHSDGQLHSFYYTSFLLLVSLALCWATPASVWYQPGCWIQPVSGRNIILGGPTSTLARFRVYAARLGLCLAESFGRGPGREAIALQAHWAIPDSVYLDMAQLELLELSVPHCYLNPELEMDATTFRISSKGVGPTFYVPTLFGVTNTDPRFYLALRRRNADLFSNPHRVRVSVLECLSLLRAIACCQGNTWTSSSLSGTVVARVLGLAKADLVLRHKHMCISSYFNEVRDIDITLGRKSMLQLDLEYYDDLVDFALDDSDDDIPDDGEHSAEEEEDQEGLEEVPEGQAQDSEGHQEEDY